MHSIASSSVQQENTQKPNFANNGDLNNKSIADLREIQNISRDKYQKLKEKAMNELSSDEDKPLK